MFQRNRRHYFGFCAAFNSFICPSIPASFNLSKNFIYPCCCLSAYLSVCTSAMSMISVVLSLIVAFRYTVLVTGLPSSASWQDLKVLFCWCFLFMFVLSFIWMLPSTYRIICVELEMFAFPKCSVMVVVSILQAKQIFVESHLVNIVMIEMFLLKTNDANFP